MTSSFQVLKHRVTPLQREDTGLSIISPLRRWLKHTWRRPNNADSNGCTRMALHSARYIQRTPGLVTQMDSCGYVSIHLWFCNKKQIIVLKWLCLWIKKNCNLFFFFSSFFLRLMRTSSPYFQIPLTTSHQNGKYWPPSFWHKLNWILKIFRPSKFSMT